jgi:UDP-N-acetylglucosamine transferase subunit ALG13
VVALLVASIGGHLTQLHQLRPRLPVDEVMWVTNDSPHSRSLLAGEDVEFVRYVAPRDARTAVSLLPSAWRACGRTGIDIVISTGSAIAVPYLVAAASRRRRAVYIESATRADGPSLAGKLLARVPTVGLFTQSPTWADRRWRYVGSVLDGYRSAPRDVTEIRRVVVSLGTIKGYPFRALVDRLHAILPEGIDVLWQVGEVDVSDLGIAARDVVPSDELRDAMAAADVVVAHAGTGIALSAMEAGRCPVLVPRRQFRHEHVDDHQLQTARRLADSDVAIASEVEELTWDHLVRAAALRVERRDDAPMMDLR